MPIKEFRCDECGTITEKFFRSFSAAEGVDQVNCPRCVGRARLIFSVPLPAMFYGNPDGYHKPSATKRYSTKLVAQKGNDAAAG